MLCLFHILTDDRMFSDSNPLHVGLSPFPADLYSLLCLINFPRPLIYLPYFADWTFLARRFIPHFSAYLSPLLYLINLPRPPIYRCQAWFITFTLQNINFPCPFISLSPPIKFSLPADLSPLLYLINFPRPPIYHLYFAEYKLSLSNYLPFPADKIFLARRFIPLYRRWTKYAPSKRTNNLKINKEGDVSRSYVHRDKLLFTNIYVSKIEVLFCLYL